MSNKLTATVTTMGIDIGKSSFRVVGLDERGAIVRAVQLLHGHARSRAPSDTLASRSTMRLRLPRKLMSEIPGQGCGALPAGQSVEKGQAWTRVPQ